MVDRKAVLEWAFMETYIHLDLTLPGTWARTDCLPKALVI